MIHIHMFLSIYRIYCQFQFFTLKYIMGLSIFAFGGNKERKSGAMNIVDVVILS